VILCIRVYKYIDASTCIRLYKKKGLLRMAVLGTIKKELLCMAVR